MLNKIKEPKENSYLDWLCEILDFFLEDLIDLPSSPEIYHEIEIFPSSEPISKRSYKMSLPKAIKIFKNYTRFSNKDCLRPLDLGRTNAIQKKKDVIFTCALSIGTKPSKEQTPYFVN